MRLPIGHPTDLDLWMDGLINKQQRWASWLAGFNDSSWWGVWFVLGVGEPGKTPEHDTDSDSDLVIHHLDCTPKGKSHHQILQFGNPLFHLDE